MTQAKLKKFLMNQYNCLAQKNVKGGIRKNLINKSSKACHHKEYKTVTLFLSHNSGLQVVNVHKLLLQASYCVPERTIPLDLMF